MTLFSSHRTVINVLPIRFICQEGLETWQLEIMECCYTGTVWGGECKQWRPVRRTYRGFTEEAKSFPQCDRLQQAAISSHQCMTLLKLMDWLHQPYHWWPLQTAVHLKPMFVALIFMLIKCRKNIIKLTTEITVLRKAVLPCCVIYLQIKENHNKVVENIENLC